MKNTRTKKHSFKTRLIATALSAITILSVGAMSFSTASVTASAASIEETGKKIGIDATDAAFDTIADLFPGGKILLSPFQSLFHSGVDDKDPMEIIDEKLDQIDNKLDKLDEKLTELNQNINKNTEWMAQKVQNTSDMSELRAEFKGLSPQLAKFVKSAFIEPEIHQKLKRRPSGRKMLVTKRIERDIPISEYFENGKVELENSSFCGRICNGHGYVGLRLIYKIFSEYQKNGEIPHIISIHA